MLKLTLWAVGLGLAFTHSAPPGAHVTAHIIAHSHCDPGWLETMETYYAQQVHAILDNVLEQLTRKSTRRFVWSETSFLKMWWDGLQPHSKARTRALVLGGQLEFVGGGWVQHDEASPTLNARITEEIEGHEWLLRTFGVKPKVAWQIDPFGHSSLTPQLFAAIGFSALVINRIPFDVKDGLKGSQGMEFLWQQPGLSPEQRLFTHVLHTHYSAPHGFDWEEPDALPISDGSLGSVATKFSAEIKSRASAYRTSQLLVPFGDDFKFQAAELQFGNMDRLISEVNKRSSALGVRMQYSTLSQYFEAVAAELLQNKMVPPSYTGDFFPYADNSDSWWTGYYTSRPTLKGTARIAESAVRAAGMLMVFARAMEDASGGMLTGGDFGTSFERLQDARRGVSLAQHHDGLTGTSKSYVNSDFLTKLDAAIGNADSVAIEMQQYLMSQAWLPLPHRPSDQIRVKELTDTLRQGGLLLHNALGWTRTEVVQIMVDSLKVAVYSPEGTPLGKAAQVRPQWHYKATTELLAASESMFQLSFVAQVPPFGMATYFIKSNPSDVTHTAAPAELLAYESCQRGQRKSQMRGQSQGSVTYRALTEALVLQNEFVSVELAASNALPSKMTLKSDGSSVMLAQKLMMYETLQSGAYIFRTNNADAVVIQGSCTTVGVSIGSVTQDALIKISGGIGLKVSLDKGQTQLDLDLSATPESNQEIITRFSTNVQNTKGTFFVDNGVRMVPRRRMPSIEASYVPLVHRASLESTEHRFAVICSQAVGVASLAIGQLELMVHRNLMQDDGRGLGEGLNDGSTTNMMLRLMINQAADSHHTARAAMEINNLLTSSVRMVDWPLTKSLEEVRSSMLTTWAPLKTELPPDLHVVSLNPRDAASSTAAMQLQRFPSIGPAEHSSSGVNLNEIFTDFTLEHIQERTLSLHTHSGSAAQNKLQFGPKQHAAAVLEQISFGPAAQALGRTGSSTSQNTDEQGVFISHAALKKAAVPSRHLLSSTDQKLPTDWPVRPYEVCSLLFTLAPNADLQIVAPNHNPPVAISEAWKEHLAQRPPLPDAAPPIPPAPDPQQRQQFGVEPQFAQLPKQPPLLLETVAPWSAPHAAQPILPSSANQMGRIMKPSELVNQLEQARQAEQARKAAHASMSTSTASVITVQSKAPVQHEHVVANPNTVDGARAEVVKLDQELRRAQQHADELDGIAAGKGSPDMVIMSQFGKPGPSRTSAGPDQSNPAFSNWMLFGISFSWIALVCVMCYLFVYKGLLRSARKGDRPSKKEKNKRLRRPVQEPREGTFLDRVPSDNKINETLSAKGSAPSPLVSDKLSKF